MNDVTVSCGCGRKMTLDAIRGRGAYRCGCGARIKIAEHEQDVSRCLALLGKQGCRKSPVTPPPAPLCWEHLGELRVTTGLILPDEVDEFSDLLAAAQFRAMDEAVPKEFFLARIAAARAAAREREAKVFMERVRYSEQVLHVVYFIGMGDLIKIGTTTNLQRRVMGLSLTMGHVLATEPGGYALEEKLHEKFTALREHGEWFRAEPELLAYVEEVKARPKRRRHAS